MYLHILFLSLAEKHRERNFIVHKCYLNGLNALVFLIIIFNNCNEKYVNKFLFCPSNMMYIKKNKFSAEFSRELV